LPLESQGESAYLLKLKESHYRLQLQKQKGKHHYAKARPGETPQKPPAEISDVGRDLLVGIDAIAEFLNQPRRRVQRWADIRAIPLTKCGFLWTGSKSVLRRHFTGGEAA
jgi:hypothetical protein